MITDSDTHAHSRPAPISWLFILCTTVLGLSSIALGLIIIIAKELPRIVAPDDAGLFYLLRDFLGTPLDFYFTGSYLIAQGVFFMFIPVYFMHRIKHAPTRDTERDRKLQHRVPLTALTLLFAIPATLCFEVNFDTLGYILTLPIIILFLASKLGLNQSPDQSPKK